MKAAAVFIVLHSNNREENKVDSIYLKINKMKRLNIIATFILAINVSAAAQGKYCADEIKDMKLPFLPGKINTYYSAGVEKRANELKIFLERAPKLFEDSLKVKIDLTMAVLAPKEWEALMDKPYGLPTMRLVLVKEVMKSFQNLYMQQ